MTDPHQQDDVDEEPFHGEEQEEPNESGICQFRKFHFQGVKILLKFPFIY